MSTSIFSWWAYAGGAVFLWYLKEVVGMRMYLKDADIYTKKGTFDTPLTLPKPGEH